MTKEILPGQALKYWYVYIVNLNQEMYVGMTSDIQNRLRQHNKPDLLYYEVFESKDSALKRERQIKGWTAAKKWDLIIEFSQQQCLSAEADR